MTKRQVVTSAVTIVLVVGIFAWLLENVFRYPSSQKRAESVTVID